MAALEVRRQTAATSPPSSSFPFGCTADDSLGASPDHGAAPFLDRGQNPFFEHAEAEYFLCERDGVVAAASAPMSMSAGPSSRAATTACSASSGRRTTPRWRAPSRGRHRVAARARRSGCWAHGLHHQRRVRPARRRPRARSADPRALAPALPPGAARGARHDEGHGPPDLAPGDGEASRATSSTISSIRRRGSDHGDGRPCARCKRDLDTEIARFMEVYNEAWGTNWGFVPITEEEVRLPGQEPEPIWTELGDHRQRTARSWARR